MAAEDSKAAEPEHLPDKLRGGTRLFGTMVVSPSPHWPAAIKATGADVVFIDTEHIPMDRHQLSWMCRTYDAMGMTPIVRVPEPEPFRVCEYIDGGAVGIVAPYVETVEQVRALVGAVKLRPLKGQRLIDALDCIAAGKPVADAVGEKVAAHVAELNKRLALLINIESIPAIENLDELLKWPVDAVLIGPHDLSVNIGHPREWSHPEFLGACKTIIEKARAAGKGAGNHYSFDKAIERQAEWISYGANLIMHSADVKAVATTLSSEFAAIKELADGAGGAGPDSAAVDEVGEI